MSVEQRLAAMSLSLPSLSKPRFRYVPFKRAGEIVHISGQVPRLADGSLLTGKVGSERSVEEAREAAKLCGLHILAVAKSITGSLEEIEMIKVFGMVNAVPDFGDQPLVIDACSTLLEEVLRENGRHARSAIGVGSLPSNVMVEIDAVVRVIS